MAEELFADYAPTPGYAARLKATAAQQATGPQLVALHPHATVAVAAAATKLKGQARNLQWW